MLNGASAPQSAVGSEGDFYINTATNQIYGPKTASGWGIGTSLVGPQGAQGIQGPQGPAGATGPQGLQGPAGPVGATGAQGSSMLSGTGTPASSLGVNGDSYVDAATGTVYKKTSGTWTSTGQTLKGPQGVAGPAGATGPQGLQGPIGPSGVITATNGLIYTANTQTVSLPTATNGQVLKWNGTAWAPGTDNNTNTTYTAGTGLSLSGTTFSHAAHTGDVTGTTSLTIANNAVNSAKIADGSVSTVDLAAGAVTADKLNQMNATNGQVLKWNGTAWAPAADNNTNTTYSGSTSITLSGTSFQRAALTGDVTAAANNNITTVARIQGRNVANTAPASGQVLKWNGTAWAPAADDNTNTTYTAGTGLSLSGTTFSHAAHTGDVTGTTSLTIANNAVNSAKIADGSVSTVDLAAGAVTADKLNQMNATNGQVLKWNGTAWAPAADNNTNTTYSGSTSITLSGTSFQRAALAGDVTAAANNNTTTVARIQGRNVANTTPASGQVLKWNGTAWAPAADDNTNTTYSGSTSITLSGTSFQRAALTGDVTAAVNNNTTTVARIQGRNVANTTPASGQVLKWNGTAWAPAADDNTNTTYSGSTSITLSGTSFQRAALTGDVTAAVNNNTTTVARIQGRNVANTTPASGQVLKWNGTAWAPAADDNTNTNI
ncbi:collagen-like protein [Riemerella anatipestifer]|nr:collagen-like protein [Riemerella anatipestifer]MDR7797041.1 collagen-like protein [Riemerella anatipestifer]MDY3433385.1 collagen-like protein [Riemerella anatipestifer]MDY3444806.1 collagen-like protein [Riemerella anatipestifer]QZO86903.1 collagen-like protein [Riemerella anatipestifer]QZO94542.1 collagen-like protein [Riemerella anatipestifer]